MLEEFRYHMEEVEGVGPSLWGEDQKIGDVEGGSVVETRHW